jgi:hypothetical protein
MSWFFRKKKEIDNDDYVSIWKVDFSDCVAADYLPGYSVCQCGNNRTCRYVARYAGMKLCGNPNHKSFIPEGAEIFNPHKDQFSN